MTECIGKRLPGQCSRPHREPRDALSEEFLLPSRESQQTLEPRVLAGFWKKLDQDSACVPSTTACPVLLRPSSSACPINSRTRVIGEHFNIVITYNEFPPTDG